MTNSNNVRMIRYCDEQSVREKLPNGVCYFFTIEAKGIGAGEFLELHPACSNWRVLSTHTVGVSVKAKVQAWLTGAQVVNLMNTAKKFEGIKVEAVRYLEIS